MLRLTGFELGKIWGRRSFRLSMCVLLLLNLFLLWYVNLPGEEAPSLFSYRTFGRETAGMSQEEKGEYLTGLKRTIDGVCFVQEILNLQRISGEMGIVLLEQALQEKPGVFEAYYDLYQSGDYLRLTDSLWKEKALIDELYEEWQKVEGYENYLQSVQERKDTLGAISIFGGGEENSFSARNIQKSAGDYGRLTGNGVRWVPSKALVSALESIWTDLLLLLSVFLFVGKLTLEEKEKGLIFITRSTRNGHVPSILGKLTALWIHCTFAAILLYSVNFIFFGLTVGFEDLGAAIQSAAPYMESSLAISIWQYILLSLFTKGFILFGFGAVLAALGILADRLFLPYFAGLAICGGSYVLYTVIPAASKGAMFKYLNLMGMMKTESLYGAYLNFNLFGQPVSRTVVVWIAALGIAGIGILASVAFFVRGEHLKFREKKIRRRAFFRPHSNMLRHECYKIMIMNRAGMVLLCFGLLTGYREWTHSYRLSIQEQYYQDIMLRLEGELTEEKETLVLAEKARYEEAFEQIRWIDRMIAEGNLDEWAGESAKSEWLSVTAFYPSFCKVWQQYERVCGEGGIFLYDTGYRYLFGTMNEEYLIDLLLLSCCVILAFGNGIAMEEERGSWGLLGATLHGRRRILTCKIEVCIMATVILAPVPFVCRIISVSRGFPMHGLTASVRNIPYWQNFVADFPIGAFALLFVLSQMTALILVTLAVLLLSWWRRDAVQAYFFAALLFIAPLVLKILGFSFAGWFSVYPLYSWP